MENQNKDLEKIEVERDSLQTILKQTDANYQNLKVEMDILSVKHNKLQKDYKKMEQTFLKQQKELEFKVDNVNAYQANNDIQRQFNQRHAQMDRNLQKQKAFNEKLQKLLKETQEVKPFNHHTKMCPSSFQVSLDFE